MDDRRRPAALVQLPQSGDDQTAEKGAEPGAKRLASKHDGSPQGACATRWACLGLMRCSSRAATQLSAQAW